MSSATASSSPAVDIAPLAEFPMLMLSEGLGLIWSIRSLDHLTLWNSSSLARRDLEGATLIVPSLRAYRVVRAEKVAPKPPFFGWTLWFGRVWRMRLLVEPLGDLTLAEVRSRVLTKMREDAGVWHGELKAVRNAGSVAEICLALPARTDL